MVIMYDDVCSVAPANGGINPKVVIQLNHVREPNNSSILCHHTHTYIYIHRHRCPFPSAFSNGGLPSKGCCIDGLQNQFPKATLATLAPNKSSIIKLEMVSNRVPPGSSRVLCDPARRHLKIFWAVGRGWRYPFWTESYPVVQEIM